jgi:diguanylate cyclase (GGDEF)-like protein/PAS domain S-box-containing protein
MEDAMSRHQIPASIPQHQVAEMYRIMVDEIHECAVFLMDPKGIITSWNKAAEVMKGFTAEDAIGQYLGMLYTDAEVAKGSPQHNLDMAAKDGFYREEQWRKRKDGTLFWANIAITAIHDDDGQLLGFSKVTLDLTGHKQLEQCMAEREEIDMILRAAQSGTWKWNVATDQVDVSSHFVERLGADGTRMSFEAWTHFIHPEDRDYAVEQFHRVRDQHEPSLEIQLRVRRKDTEYHWYHVCAGWRHEGDQAPAELLGVCVDVQSLRQAQENRDRAKRVLNEERSRFAMILDQLPSGVVLVEAPSGKLTYQNQAAVQMLGSGHRPIASLKDYDDYHFTDVYGQPIASEDLPLARTIRSMEATRSEEMLYQHPNGSLSHLAVTTAPIFDEDHVARMAVAVVYDVSNLKQAQLAAATEKEKAEVTLAAITDGVLATDLDGNVATINPAAERLTGWSRDEALGRPIGDVVKLVDEVSSRQPFIDTIKRCLLERRVIPGVPHATLASRHGQRYSIDSAVAPVNLGGGELIGTVLVFHDVTEARRLMHQLGFEASHDALTGLVNRREFEARLGRTLERSRLLSGSSSALLYMDLDQFKVVNDSCGHAAGDELLQMLAQLYREHVRERDTLARIGGDEFALIVEHCSLAEALAVANKVLEATGNFRYPCKGGLFQLGVSIGLIPIDSHTVSVEQALRQADRACYIAKERGRNRVYVHQPGEADLMQRRSDMHWVMRLSEAFQNDQLQLYCQPIVPLQHDGAALHYEILLRIKSGGSPIRPGTFLPAAERYDMMPSVDRWVLRSSLAWLEQHPEHTAALDMCTINISRRTLADQSFQAYAADLIDHSSVPAHKLCFEITENGAIANMQKTISFIDALSRRGCRFSLDDFGTGMTSFSYLKQLPVDFIKIDGSFIQMMSSSKVDFEMVRFTNEISHMMGRKTIAEYVTDQAIFRHLGEIGVDYAQGYWVGKPRPLGDAAPTPPAAH